jgi:hypothetical protein
MSEFYTAASVKMTVLWLLGPYSLAEVYGRLRGTSCLHYQGNHSDFTAQKTATICTNIHALN